MYMILYPWTISLEKTILSKSVTFENILFFKQGEKNSLNNKQCIYNLL